MKDVHSSNSRLCRRITVMQSILTSHGWSSPHQDNLDSVRWVVNLMQYPKFTFKSPKSFKQTKKSFSDPSWPGLHTSEVFGKCFSTLLSCSLPNGRCPFSRSHWDHMGPSSPSLSLHQACCLPKPCHTWVQKIKESCSAYNHTAAARAKLPSLLHFLCFQHMCFQGWPLILHLCALLGLWNSVEWQLWKLSAVSLCLWRCYPLWFVQLSVSLSVCLFLFVCFALTVESHILSRSMRRRLLQSHSAKP